MLAAVISLFPFGLVKSSVFVSIAVNHNIDI